MENEEYHPYQIASVYAFQIKVLIDQRKKKNTNLKIQVTFSSCYQQRVILYLQ